MKKTEASGEKKMASSWQVHF